MNNKRRRKINHENKYSFEDYIQYFDEHNHHQDIYYEYEEKKLTRQVYQLHKYYYHHMKEKDLKN